MTNSRPVGGRGAGAFPTLPKGEIVASYESYAEAQSGVDSLVRGDFPLAEVAIIGTDLQSVERVTGKMSWGRAAAGGALSGVWLGMFVGLLLFIFSPTPAAIGILLSALLIGAGFGVIFGVVSYSVNRRRRDFTSVMQVIATRYGILVSPEHANRARNLLGVDEAPAAAVPPAPIPTTPESERPEPPAGAMTYGEAQDAARRRAAEQRARPAYGERVEPEGEAPSQGRDGGDPGQD